MSQTAKIERYKKGHILQRSGDSKAFTFFVKKGLLRSYIVDDKGKEHIFTFAPEGWVIADVESLEYNQSVTLFIDCLEDSEVVVIEKDYLFNQGISKENLIEHSKLLFRRMASLQRRVLMLMSVPAITRYAYFEETYPELLNRVPQRMIATYLGITPQALSSLRSKRSRNGQV